TEIVVGWKGGSTLESPSPRSPSRCMGVISRPRVRSRHDRLHHFALGVGVILHVFPGATREPPLRLLIELPVRGLVPEPVPEANHPLDLGASLGEDVDVGGQVPGAEDPVLVPLRLPYSEYITGRCE